MHVTIRGISFTLVALIAACSASRGADSTSSAARDSAATRVSTSPESEASRTWAATGDTVWILMNPVKADKRAQFEEFFDAFIAAGLKSTALDSTQAKSFKHSRILIPTKPSPDGTYSYVIMMDPVIPGVNYEIGGMLTRLFPAAEADRLGKLLESSMAGPQQQMTLIQRLPR